MLVSQIQIYGNNLKNILIKNEILGSAQALPIFIGASKEGHCKAQILGNINPDY